jgi:fumarate reductase flavoprotein subunit
MSARARRVLVAGGGLGGWVPAVAAAEAGADVTLVEKTAQPGGSTVLSGGFFALAGSPFQEARGVVDSAELLEADLLEVGEGASDPRLVQAYSQGQGLLIDWLLGHGLCIEDVELSSGQSVPRSHRADPRAFIDVLHQRALSLGVDFRPNTPVTGLEVDDGKVTGAQTAEGAVPADAVVLATGGFSRSEELLAAYAPGQSRALRVGGAGNTGDGLAIGIAAGAGTRDFEHVKGTFGTHPSTGPDKHEILLTYYVGGIIVNQRGARFVDESVSYKLIGDAALAQPGTVAFQVFDQSVLEDSPVGVPLFDPRPMIERGLVLQSDTLQDLAAKAGLPVGALTDTLSAYNDVARGAAFDPLGRTHLVGATGPLRAIERPPFYAFPSTTVLLATYCGLTVDARARVLDTSGRAIEGLWAVGEVMGGFHGAAYMTGSSLGKAAYFGIVAGRDAAAREKE